MTSPLVPILPGQPTAAKSAAPAGAGATAGAAFAGLDFSGMLLAMLPAAAVLLTTDGTGGDSRDSGTGTGKQTKSGDADQQPDQLTEQPADDPGKTVPLTAIVPLPVLPLLTPPPPGEDARASAETETAASVAVPDQRAMLAALTAMPTPAQIPIPAEPADTAAADAGQVEPALKEVAAPAPGAALPAPDVSTGKPSGPELKTSATAGKAELAFAARLTTAPGPAGDSQPHPAVLPETLSAKTVAGPPAAEISGPAAASAGTDARAMAWAGGAPKAAPAAMPVETAVRIPPVEPEQETEPITAAKSAMAPAGRMEGSKVGSVEPTTSTGSTMAQPEKEYRGQDPGSDPRSGGHEQRPSDESLLSAAAPAVRADGQSTAKPEPMSRALAPAAAASTGTAETPPSRPEAPAQPVRELSVVVPGRVSANGRPGPDVEVRIVERTGEMHVTVRTSDTQLSSSLRENLPQMVSELADRGYRAETWHPGAATAEGAVARTENSATEFGNDGGFRQSGRGDSDTPGQGGGQGGQRRNQENAPEWLETLERSMGSAKVRSRSIL